MGEQGRETRRERKVEEWRREDRSKDRIGEERGEGGENMRGEEWKGKVRGETMRREKRDERREKRREERVYGSGLASIIISSLHGRVPVTFSAIIIASQRNCRASSTSSL